MFHSFRTMVMHGKDAAWYLITSGDGNQWYATLETYNFYQKNGPPKVIYMHKDLQIGWLCYSVNFNEIGMEALRKLPNLDGICIELIASIDQYIQFKQSKF
jgi:hypothetical protein